MTEKKPPRPKKRAPLRRGVAILPSLFSLGNMLLGYYAVVLAFKHRFSMAVSMVILAGVLDMLDGRVARMTGTSSEFGKELDSLSDFMSFGIAPALILYHWGFKDLGRTGWLLAFLLPVAGAVRLARFNVQAHVVDKKYFIGLPIPAAAAAAVLPLSYLPDGLPIGLKAAALAYVVALSFLMVSRVKYRSFKDLDVHQRRPSIMVFLMALILVLIFLNPPAVLLALAVTFAASGPALWVWERIFPRRRQLKKKGRRAAGKETLDETT
ncbi:MAG: CDP-diacylglycerol--serine O-phosphatidyltransferase [Acidobacteriota bacterium]